MPPALLLLLAFVGGYADAGSFMLVASFTGHMTGNTVLAMIALATGAWRQAALCLLAVGGFAAGTAAGAVWHTGEAPGGRLRLTAVLAGEIVLAGAGLVSLALVHPGGDIGFILCFCLALGSQNGALRGTQGVGLHTSYVTGMSTNLIGLLIAGPTAGQGNARRLLTGQVAGFSAGAFAGAVLTAWLGIGGFAGIFAPMVASLLVATFARAAR